MARDPNDPEDQYRHIKPNELRSPFRGKSPSNPVDPMPKPESLKGAVNKDEMYAQEWGTVQQERRRLPIKRIAMTDDLNESYMQTRIDTRQWVDLQVAEVSGEMGAGTPTDPKTQMWIDSAEGEGEGPPRKEKVLDTPEQAAQRQQILKETQPKQGLSAVLNAVTLPGDVLTANIAKSYGIEPDSFRMTGDELLDKLLTIDPKTFYAEAEKRGQSEAALKAMHGVAGLALGVSLDPLRFVGMGGGKQAGKALEKQKEQVLAKFQEAVDVLKSERGSTPMGGPQKEPLKPSLPAIPPEHQARMDEAGNAFKLKVQGFQEEVTKQRRGPVLPDVEVKRLASQSGYTWQALLDTPPGTALPPELLVAAKDTFKAGAERMRVAAKAAIQNPGNDAVMQEFMNALGETGTATTKIIGLYAETGRSTRLMNRKLPIGQAAEDAAQRDPEFRIADPFINQMYDFFKQASDEAMIYPDAVTAERLVEMASALKTDQELAVFAKAITKPTWWDMGMEVWINGLLSGPITHSTNIISNAATLAWGIPERAVAATFSRSVRPGEAQAMLGGVVESIGDAWRLAWKAFKAEESQLGMGKMEGPRKAITADALELTGTVGRAVDYLGVAIRLPGRFLLSADDFFKGIAYRAELRALALREAFSTVNAAGLTGKEARAAVKEAEARILANPPESIKDAAQEFAAYTTFTRELGETGKKIQEAASTPIGRVILPFVRTPTNIFKYAGERTPFALASKAVREEISAGGERRALALAKISLGSMTMAYVGSLAADGLITGGGPKDKRLRDMMHEATGWQPYSIKVKDQWISYARIEPLASIFGMGADAADLMGQLHEKDAEELAAALVVAVSRNVGNKTFVKGLAGTLTAVTSQDVKEVGNFLEKELPTLLPYSSALGQTARYTDPVMHDVQSIMDAFKAKVPGWSKELPPRRNLWGEPIVLQGGFGPDLISPLYTSKVQDDPVSAEIVRLELPLSMPSRQIDGIHLMPKEYDVYAELAGKNLKARLTKLMDSDLYKRGSDGPDGGKAVLIRQAVSEQRDRAKQEMLKQFDDLRQQVDFSRLQKAKAFSGEQPTMPSGMLTR